MAVQYRWKGFGVYLNFGFKYGHVLKKETIEYHRLFEKWEGHRDYSKRWQQPGDEKWTSVPSMIYPAVENRDFFYANSAANIIRGDLVRLQDIRLSKDFVLGRESNRQKRVAAYLNVQHVGLIWTANNEGIDPDFNRLPTPRAYVFGITYNL